MGLVVDNLLEWADSRTKTKTSTHPSHQNTMLHMAAEKEGDLAQHSLSTIMQCSDLKCFLTRFACHVGMAKKQGLVQITIIGITLCFLNLEKQLFLLCDQNPAYIMLNCR